VTARDLERLVDQRAIYREHQNLVEYRHTLAMDAAEYLAAPRVKLVDEQWRIVRVVNARQRPGATRRGRCRITGQTPTTNASPSRSASSSAKRRRWTWTMSCSTPRAETTCWR
jgi:hypothetical protein